MIAYLIAFACLFGLVCLSAGFRICRECDRWKAAQEARARREAGEVCLRTQQL